MNKKRYLIEQCTKEEWKSLWAYQQFKRPDDDTYFRLIDGEPKPEVKIPPEIVEDNGVKYQKTGEHRLPKKNEHYYYQGQINKAFSDHEPKDGFSYIYLKVEEKAKETIDARPDIVKLEDRVKKLEDKVAKFERV